MGFSRPCNSAQYAKDSRLITRRTEQKQRREKSYCLITTPWLTRTPVDHHCCNIQWNFLRWSGESLPSPVAVIILPSLSHSGTSWTRGRIVIVAISAKHSGGILPLISMKENQHHISSCWREVDVQQWPGSGSPNVKVHLPSSSTLDVIGLWMRTLKDADAEHSQFIISNTGGALELMPLCGDLHN